VANMLFKTKGNAAPGGKPRVYFTCHPADFEKYFDKICDDIFATHQCAIYYTVDMTEAIPQADWETDLGSNNLFVVPVTFQLLTEPNRAMDQDIPYAIREHIPVLPFMMEPGLDAVYSRPDRFGELQYLNPFSQDRTEISYWEKLRKYLESVLISDEMAKRIRAAFDAYIFLSYRKKDRRYANELMQLIHKNPECRDIAIWYDEFLTPGESFKESIEKILADSKLFTLLVTPNILEEPEGKPNFVMGKEYPAARASQLPILPAEMEATDKAQLGEKFKDIPDCVDTHDDAAFRARLLSSIERIAIRENSDDPEHNFLIGLAYLEGIDVETDRQRGLSLITAAAESGMPEAMEKLYNLYSAGVGGKSAATLAIKWAERLVQFCKKEFGPEHPVTLLYMQNHCDAVAKAGIYEQALKLQSALYALSVKVMGPEHVNTVGAMNQLASLYSALGQPEKALELQEKVCSVRGKHMEADDPAVLTFQTNLAYCCINAREYAKAKELLEPLTEKNTRIYGELHEKTLDTKRLLAVVYDRLGDSQKALTATQEVYELYCRGMGEEHPDTLSTLCSLGCCYRNCGQTQKAKELLEQAYAVQSRTLPGRHPDLITPLMELADMYIGEKAYEKALPLQQKLYLICDCSFGAEHPTTLRERHNLGYVYGQTGDWKAARKHLHECYQARKKILGPEHPGTLTTMKELAYAFFYTDNEFEAMVVMERHYKLCIKVFGEAHPTTLSSRKVLSSAYRGNNRCQACGGKFIWLFGTRCRKCRKPKDYEF